MAEILHPVHAGNKTRVEKVTNSPAVLHGAKRKAVVKHAAF